MQDKNKIRILYIYPSLTIGGAEELRLLTLMNLRQKKKYEIKVCCIEDIGEVGERIRDLGIEVFCLNRSSRPANLSVSLSLTAYLLKNRFDIVQTALFNANFHGRIAAFIARIPIIITEEHSEHYQYRSLKFLPYIWSDRILAKFTSRIICCSMNLMNSLSTLEHIPQQKLFLLINTFNVDKLMITKTAREVKQDLGLSQTDLVIGNIASLSYRKGQDILIKAFKLIRNENPCAKLIFIGKEVHEYKQELLSLMRELGLSEEILFLGVKGNIADYLNIMDIFVLSSRFEGIPLAMLEAMYMQVPVVTTEVGGVSEVITHNKNGFLVTPNNAESLSKSVIGLLNNKEKQIRFVQEAKKTVLERFGQERYIDQLEDLYSKLLRAKNGKFCK